MPVMGDDYDYDEYQVYITLPEEYTLDEVIRAGARFLDGNGPVAIPEDSLAMEINWVDSHSI